MTGKRCAHKAHTPIVSKRQAGFFGAEMGRKESGKQTKTGMSKTVLRAHLKEYGGKSRRGG